MMIMSSHQWKSQFDDWLCHGQSGVIAENYQDPEIFFNYHDTDNHYYNLLCSFDYNFALEPEDLTLHILYQVS
jgi:hypothetical protein